MSIQSGCVSVNAKWVCIHQQKKVCYHALWDIWGLTQNMKVWYFKGTLLTVEMTGLKAYRNVLWESIFPGKPYGTETCDRMLGLEECL